MDVCVNSWKAPMARPGHYSDLNKREMFQSGLNDRPLGAVWKRGWHGRPLRILHRWSPLRHLCLWPSSLQRMSAATAGGMAMEHEHHYHHHYGSWLLTVHLKKVCRTRTWPRRESGKRKTSKNQRKEMCEGNSHTECSGINEERPKIITTWTGDVWVVPLFIR